MHLPYTYDCSTQYCTINFPPVWQICINQFSDNINVSVCVVSSTTVHYCSLETKSFCQGWAHRSHVGEIFYSFGSAIHACVTFSELDNTSTFSWGTSFQCSVSLTNNLLLVCAYGGCACVCVCTWVWVCVRGCGCGCMCCVCRGASVFL